MRVFVYYNIRKKCWSIRDCKTRRVIGHSDLLCLRDVTFKVSAAGRARVLKEGRKNVHAGCEGTPESRLLGTLGAKLEAEQVTYNPYKYESFVRVSDKSPVEVADFVLMCRGEVFAVNPLSVRT